MTWQLYASTASLMIGVAASSASKNAILVAGSMSMVTAAIGRLLGASVR